MKRTRRRRSAPLPTIRRLPHLQDKAFSALTFGLAAYFGLKWLGVVK
jgi:hypothetical protein